MTRADLPAGKVTLLFTAVARCEVATGVGLAPVSPTVFDESRLPALMPVHGGHPILVVQSGIFTHPTRQPGQCPDDIGCGTFP